MSKCGGSPESFSLASAPTRTQRMEVGLAEKVGGCPSTAKLLGKLEYHVRYPFLRMLSNLEHLCKLAE